MSTAVCQPAVCQPAVRLPAVCLPTVSGMLSPITRPTITPNISLLPVPTRPHPTPPPSAGFFQNQPPQLVEVREAVCGAGRGGFCLQATERELFARDADVEV